MTKLTGGATMMRFRVVSIVMSVACALTPAVSAHADPPPPELGNACSAELVDFMTLLPDQTTYVVCESAGPAYTWATAQTPFPPSDKWLSYGPAITLHGQGMRNPNLTSGQWTATPQDPESTCKVTETTVVEAGVLAEPQVFEGESGEPLAVPMLPRLFYAELAGNCLWVKGS